MRPSPLDIGIREPPTGFVVTLKGVGDKLFGIFKYPDGIAKHKYGPKALPTAGCSADFTGNCNGNFQDFRLDSVSKFEKIGDREAFDGVIHVCQDNKVSLLLINVSP